MGSAFQSGSNGWLVQHEVEHCGDQSGAKVVACADLFAFAFGSSDEIRKTN